MLNMELPGKRKTTEKIHGCSERGPAEGLVGQMRMLGTGRDGGGQSTMAISFSANCAK